MPRALGSRRAGHHSRGKVISIHFEVPPVLPAIVVFGIVCLFVISMFESAAAMLPLLSLAALALSGVEFIIARYAKPNSASSWDIAAALVLISVVAGSLSEAEHILAAVGLAMP